MNRLDTFTVAVLMIPLAVVDFVALGVDDPVAAGEEATF
jgi:hypothetical protein